MKRELIDIDIGFVYIYKILYTQTSLYNFNDSPWLDKGSLKKEFRIS